MSKNKNRGLVPQQYQPSTPQARAQTLVAQQYSGPIPPPEAMEKYNQILPGAADRILKMAEQQSQHRQGLENSVVKGNLSHQRWGLIVGAIITIVVTVAGTILALYDKPTEGLIAILSMIGIDAGVFVFGRLRQEKDRAQKLAEIDEAKKGNQ
ncbi:MAG: DUF2335 domain-containing protein [bacterium]